MTNKVDPDTLIGDARTKAFEARHRARRKSHIMGLIVVFSVLVAAIAFLYRSESHFFLGAFLVFLMWLVSDGIRIQRMPPELFMSITEYSRQKFLLILLVALMCSLFGPPLLDWLGL